MVVAALTGVRLGGALPDFWGADVPLIGVLESPLVAEPYRMLEKNQGLGPGRCVDHGTQ